MTNFQNHIIFLLPPKIGYSVQFPFDSLHCCRYKHNTNMNVGKTLGEVRSEGEEHNIILSLRLNIVECIRGRYGEGFMRQVREFVPI